MSYSEIGACKDELFADIRKYHIDNVSDLHLHIYEYYPLESELCIKILKIYKKGIMRALREQERYR